MVNWTEPFRVENTHLEFWLDGKPVRVSGEFQLNLNPRPSIVIVLGDLPVDVEIIDRTPFVVKLENGLEIEVFVTKSRIQSNVSSSRSSIVLRPVKGRNDICRSASQLHSVEFSILNFPRFFKGDDKSHDVVTCTGRNWERLGSIVLESPPWRVDITALVGLESIEESLKAEGGYAVTHTGRMTRGDGGSFSVEEAESFVTQTLRWFLSFARGALCDVVEIIGKDAAGCTVWKRWGSHQVASWFDGRQSWFDVNHGHILREVFSGFQNQFENLIKGESLKRGLHWYVLSNRGIGFTDTDLVLVQASLELLSNIVLKRNRHRREKIDEYIREAIVQSELRVDVPSTYLFKLEYLSSRVLCLTLVAFHWKGWAFSL